MSRRKGKMPSFQTQSKFGDHIESTVLDCGLPVMVVPKRDFRKTYALIGVNYGSINNHFKTSIAKGKQRVPDGIAHFLEHKMFEKKDGDVMEKFSQLGCSSNAMTSFNHTGYLFETTGPPEVGLELLVDFVTRPYFTEELVQKEKGIIGEEIKMYLDDPSWRGFMGVLEDLYPGHPLSIDIAGSLESIAEIKASDLQLCYDAFYTPPNMHLAVAGPIDPKTVAEIAERVIHRNGKDAPVATENFAAKVRRKPLKRRRKVLSPVTNQKLYLGIKILADELPNVDPVDLEIALDIFLGAALGRSAPLYQELFRNGALDDSFGYSAYSEREYAFVMLSGDSPDAEALDRALCKGLTRCLDEGLATADLRRQRRKSFGELVRSYDSMSSLCWNLIECHAKGVDFAAYGDRVKALSNARIMEIARAALRPDRFSAHYLIPNRG
ncbi:MAG: pitrilysin family protein [Planctomycetota bacterium]